MKFTVGYRQLADVVAEIIDKGDQAKSVFQEDDHRFWTTRPEKVAEYRDYGTIHDYLANKVGFIRAGTNSFHHPGTICGARGCMMTCMMHLEENGVLGNKFAGKIPPPQAVETRVPQRLNRCNKKSAPGWMRLAIRSLTL